MRKRVFLLTVMGASVVTLLLSSCIFRRTRSWTRSDAPLVSENRSVSDFEKIEVNGSPMVYYSQADSVSVIVKGPKDLVENIQTDVSGGLLTIRNRGKIGVLNIQLDDAEEAAVYVTTPDLTAIRLNGSGDFVSHQRIDSDEMEIMLKGSGDIDIRDLICDRCQISLVGSGDLHVDCLEARDVDASLIGSGDMKLNARNVVSTMLALNGSGDIEADFQRGCKRLDCNLRGSGEISLSGQIEHFNAQKSGSGDVDSHKLTIEK